MGDFPAKWTLVRDLSEGGQAHTFIVRKADGSDSRDFVLKRLKNLKRQDYFEREMKACQLLAHRNVLPLIDQGVTAGGRPYYVSEYCEGGSLETNHTKFDDLVKGLELFRQIVTGIAYAHGLSQPIYHLDMKPANIFLKGNVAVIGDFGLCFIANGEVEFTQEGQRGSRYYCAPELRNPEITIIEGGLGAADVYSMGKILYWLFTAKVYDGSEEEYTENVEQRLVRVFPSDSRFAFVDELISSTVRRKASSRFRDAGLFLANLNDTIDRAEARGRALDLDLPKRCLFVGRDNIKRYTKFELCRMRLVQRSRPLKTAEIHQRRAR